MQTMKTIGYFSPSTPITALSPQRFLRAQAFLQEKGYRLVSGALTGKKQGYRSGSIQARADELNALIRNPEVDIIMATIGGNNSNALLPYIDYSALRRSPKTLVGYSDVTAILLAVLSQAPECRVLYGPALVASFGEFSPLVDQTNEYFEAVLNAEVPLTLQAPDQWSDERLNWERFEREKVLVKNNWSFVGSPTIKGRVIGGNLDTMAGFLRSPYFPEILDGDVLLIEDAEKGAETVERNFSMLKAAGLFDHLSGIVLGKHALYDDRGSDLRPIDLFLEVLNGQELPIIYDYDGAHTVPMITTPLGRTASFDALNQTVTFL